MDRAQTMDLKIMHRSVEIAHSEVLEYLFHRETHNASIREGIPADGGIGRDSLDRGGIAAKRAKTAAHEASVWDLRAEAAIAVALERIASVRQVHAGR